MLQFLTKLFQRFFQIFSNHATVATTPNTGDTTSLITYSDTLIPSLKHDHHELIVLYGKVSYFLNSKNYHDIDTTLMTLKTEFGRHIMQENVSFYCYLEQQFSNDPASLETIRNYRKEMNGISHAFVKFIKKWQDNAINDGNVAEFREEYDVIGAVLAQRINSEEDHLYTLYHP